MPIFLCPARSGEMDIRAAATVPRSLGLAWHGRAAERSLFESNSVMYGVPACQMSVVSHKAPIWLTTAQHCRDLLVSVKLPVATTMFQLSEKAPTVVPYRQAMRICHPIRMADKVLHHSQLLHLVSRFHQRRNWCSECR